MGGNGGNLRSSLLTGMEGNAGVPSGYLLGTQYASWYDNWYIGWVVLHVAHMVLKASVDY